MNYMYEIAYMKYVILILARPAASLTLALLSTQLIRFHTPRFGLEPRIPTLACLSASNTHQISTYVLTLSYNNPVLPHPTNTIFSTTLFQTLELTTPISNVYGLVEYITQL